MATSRIVTGTYYFAFPYLLEGHAVARLTGRCQYDVEFSNHPADGAEVRDLRSFEVETIAGGPRWVPPDAHLEGMMRAHVAHERRRELFDAAWIKGEPA